MEKIKIFIDIYFKRDITQIVTRLLTAWIIVSELLLVFTREKFTSLAFFEGSSFVIFLLLTAVGFAVLCIVSSEKTVTVIMIVSAVIYCLLAAFECSDFYFLLGCCIVISGIVYFSRVEEIKLSLPRALLWVGAGLLIVGFTAVVGTVCCMKFKNHWTPCYDFGIFAQMFHYMKETGLPLVTCERDGLLSHFAVHFSPIFYLLLPFYLIFPSPMTLMVGQCLAAATGIVPLIKICGNHGLSSLSSLIFSLCYILYPAFTGGCLYYLHENNFLAPLILWLIYFLEKDRAAFVMIFGLLTLMIKEDAAVYTAIVALYFIFAHKNYKCSISLFMVSIVYFIGVTNYLAMCGDGVMTGRYGNYIYDEGGLFSVIKAAVQNPLYVVQQAVTEKKIKYILQMLVPLMFMPFCTKKGERLILLLPFILVNIMTNYVYQYDIFYQYGFGSGAILLYLSVINYGDMGEKRKKLLICGVLSSLVIFAGTYGDRLNYGKYYGDTVYHRETIDYAIGLVPKDASVACGTFILPNMWDRDTLYQLETTENETEYYVLDLRRENDKYCVEDFMGGEYEEVFFEEGVVAVYRRK